MLNIKKKKMIMLMVQKNYIKKMKNNCQHLRNELNTMTHLIYEGFGLNEYENGITIFLQDIDEFLEEIEDKLDDLKGDRLKMEGEVEKLEEELHSDIYVHPEKDSLNNKLDKKYYQLAKINKLISQKENLIISIFDIRYDFIDN